MNPNQWLDSILNPSRFVGFIMNPMWQLEGGRKREAITLAVAASAIAREDEERKCRLREGREKREKEIEGEIEDNIFGIFTLLDQTSGAKCIFPSI